MRYPSAYLKRKKARGKHNCLANICMLPPGENKEISDSDPDNCLPQCIEGLGSHAEDVLASNFLPGAGEFMYASADFEEFIKRRSILLSKFIQQLCAGRRP